MMSCDSCTLSSVNKNYVNDNFCQIKKGLPAIYPKEKEKRRHGPKENSSLKDWVLPILDFSSDHNSQLATGELLGRDKNRQNQLIN